MADPFHSLITEHPISNPASFDISGAEMVEDQDSDSGHSDIYRGSEPPPEPIRHSSSLSVASSSSSSSWGRLRGFAQVVSALENALSRWGGSSGSTSSSSSGSQFRAITTASRSHTTKRRRRKRYPGSVYSLQSDMDFAARISLIKARAVSRQTTRYFSLYIPTSMHTPFKTTSSDSLQKVLHELEFQLRRTSKSQKLKFREEASRPIVDVHEAPHHHFMLPLPDLQAPSRPASFTDLTVLMSSKKGKLKDHNGQQTQEALPAWFLNVASPTWDDMRAIGKLLHLHPLTLEDILQKEPREKLEIFPKLGYTFISFRAIEGGGLRGKTGSIGDTINDDDQEGLLGEANVYLVIFNEGICLFHFTDISEHTERVRNRMISFAESSTMTSVDSFFPYLDDIEKEVVAIEELVFNGARESQMKTKDTRYLQWMPKLATLFNSWKPSEPHHDPETTVIANEKEETGTFRGSVVGQTRFALPRPPIPLMRKRVLRFLRSRLKLSRNDKPTPLSATSVNLRRIARTRKLVTLLNRLLASKADVIAQIRKRMLSGLAGSKSTEQLEVAIYMGDVQDHILTLQHSLAHYERMLSQSSPIYLRQLQNELSVAKFGTDKSLIILSTVSGAVLCAQFVTGLCSLNVTVPRDEQGLSVFGIVVALITLVLVVYLRLVWWWWRKAKRRRGRALKNM
ncbi:hypothetical protein L218DRAFT_1071607 [Marasmius fiardii PR-910]|nr:hypothetical protein L218DRAFT_1071607 [Marasmius fiardii PR-910]